MTRKFEQGLHTLMETLLSMASNAEKMIDVSIRALVERDPSLAADIPDMEAEVDHFQLEVDSQANLLFALQQPMAHDLRFIIASMKISNDLERIADQAINITQNTQVLMQYPELKRRMIDIPEMARIAKEMVRDALHSFVTSDSSEAMDVVLRDDQVDALKNQIFRDTLTYMISEPKTIPVGLQLILVSRHLERVADHATNIAEDVVYLVEAKDIRHHADALE